MYDAVIIGLGPAGYTAGIYCLRYNMNVLLIGKHKGGAITGAHIIENWPGDKGISGIELMNKIDRHCRDLGANIREEDAVAIKKKKDGFVITTDKNEFESKSLILCMGGAKKFLNAKGEEKFAGKGVSYCFTCDAALFKGKDVIVAGAGNSGAMACELLSQYANKIYWLVRSKITAEPSSVNNIKKLGKTEIVQGEVSEIFGSKFVEGVKLNNGKILKVSGVFAATGAVPSTALCKSIKVKVNKRGYIIADKEQKTNIKGVFCAGDVCDNILKQVITSCAEGAIAAFGAYKFIRKKGGK